MPNRPLRLLTLCLPLIACGGDTKPPGPDPEAPDAAIIDPDPDAPKPDPDAPKPDPDAPMPDAPNGPAPMIQLSPTGFVVDGNLWWTDKAQPVLAGTIDQSMATIEAVIGTQHYPGSISGTGFSIPLPAGAITTNTIATIIATGNNKTAQLAQLFSADLTPPTMSLAGSSVRDEIGDTITFPNNNGVPHHVHAGLTMNLDTTTTCTVVHKHSYFLDAVTSPLETTANPIDYKIVVGEDGVGLAPNAMYRVGYRSNGTTTWVVDWTNAGASTPGAGQSLMFDKKLFRDRVKSSLTVSGFYDIEFRASDKFGREVVHATCIDLDLLAPPVWFGPFDNRDVGYQSANHSYSLSTLKLEANAPHTQIAARLLNADSTGASLFDMEITNGTTDIAYVTIDYTGPTTANVSKRFVAHSSATFPYPVSLSCAAPNQSNCDPAQVARASGELSSTSNGFPISTHIAIGEWDPAAFDVVGPLLMPISSTGNSYKFAIPGTIGGATPKTYTIMTMVDPIPALEPANLSFPEQVFADTTIANIPISGHVYPSKVGCSKVTKVNGVPTQCTERVTVTPYQALTYANVTLGGVSMTYGVAAGATETPVTRTSAATSASFSMNTTEQSGLPDYLQPAL